MSPQFTSRNVLLVLSATACLLTGAVQDNRASRQNRHESVEDRREVEIEHAENLDERTRSDVLAAYKTQSLSRQTQRSLDQKARELAAVQQELQQIQLELARQNGTNQNEGRFPEFGEAVRRSSTNYVPRMSNDVYRDQTISDRFGFDQNSDNVDRFEGGPTSEAVTRISADQEFVRDSQQKMLELTQQLRDAKTDEQKSAAKSTLQDELVAQYDHYLQQHEEPLKKLEARVKKLREDFEGRKKAKSDLVKLRLDTIWYDSQGLGWPGQPQPSNRWAPSTGVGPTAQPFVGGNIEERFHSRPPILTPIQPGQPVGPAPLNDLPVLVAPQPPVNSRGPVGPRGPSQSVPAFFNLNNPPNESKRDSSADRIPDDQPQDGFQKTIDEAPKIFDDSDIPSFR